MKIGVVTPEYPPYQGGGIGTATVSFVRAMAAAGHDVDVFAMLRQDVQGYDTEQDAVVSEGRHVHVHYLSYSLEKRAYSNGDRAILSYLMREDVALAKAWLVFKKLESFLGRKRLDVIFSAEYLGLPAYFLLAEQAKPVKDRIPFITTLHTGHRELNLANYLSVRNIQSWEKGVVGLEKLVINQSPVLHSPSEYLARFMKDTYGLSKDIHVIPYFPAFVDGQAQDWISQRTPSSMKRVLFVGRLERRKGFKEFIDAATLLLREQKDYMFMVVGGEWHDEFSNNVYSRQILSRIPADVVSHFEILGSIPHPRLPEILRSADVVVIPSLFENYPNTCMEAVQMGVPVLVASTGGMSEIIGDDGRCVFTPSPEKMAEKIGAFFSLPAEEREIIKEKQLQYFKAKHSHQKLVRSYEDLIEKARAVFEHSSPGGIYNATVGVGIPVYNMGQYLDESLQSVFSQTRMPDRIVVIDDGSSDAFTLEKLREWKGREPKLEIVHQENCGLCSTRNRLLDILRDMDYILMLDADDALEPDYISKTEQYLLWNPHVAACTTWVSKFGKEDGYWIRPPFSFPDALIENMIVSSVALIRTTSLTEDIRFNERLSPFTAEDWDFWIQFHKKGNKIAVIPEALFRYRVRSQSKWHTLNFRKYMVIVEHLISEHREVYRDHMEDILVSLYARNYLAGSNFWAGVMRILPAGILKLLRRSATIKKAGLKLITRQ